MSSFWSTAQLWLAQCTIAASLLMLLALTLGRFTRQPARRQRIYEFGLAAALLAAGLSLAPSWLVIGLPLAGATPPSEGQAPSSSANEDLWVELVPVPDPVVEVSVPTENVMEFAHADLGGLQATLSWGLLVGGIVLTLYLIGVGFFLTRWVSGHVYLRRLIRRTEPVPAAVDDLFQSLNGPRSWPRLLLSRLLRVPISFGLWRPKVVLPADLCEPGERPKLLWVFAHELTHVERRDALSTLMLTVSQTLFFHLPWYWWLKRRVRLCQEYVADAAAVADRAADDYAEFLLSLTEAKALPLGATGVTGQVSDLYRRVSMLLQNPLRIEKRCPRWWTWGLASALLAVAVLIGGIGLQAAAGDTIVIIVPGQKAKEAPAAKEKKVTVVAPGDQRDVIVLRLDEKGNVIQSDAKGKGIVVHSVEKDGNVLKFLAGSESKPQVGKESTVPSVIVERGVRWLESQSAKEKLRPEIQRGLEYIIQAQSAGDNDRLRKAIVQLDEIIKAREKQGDLKDARELAEKLQQAVERLRKELPKKADPAKKGETKAQIVPFHAEFDYKVPQTTPPYAYTPQANAQYLYTLHQPNAVDLKKLEKLLDKLQADPAKVDPKEIKQALEELRRGAQAWPGALYQWLGPDGKYQWIAPDGRLPVQAYPNTTYQYFAYKALDTGKGRFGIRLNTPSADLADHLGLPKGEGMVIEEVYADTPAAKAGLKVKDIILKLGATPIPRDQDKALKIFADVKDGDSVDATILRKGKEGVIKGIKPAPRPQDATARFWAVRPHGALALAEPIPEKGAVVTLRRDGDKFTAKHQEKNSTITIEGTVKDGKVTATEIVVQEGGKIVSKGKSSAEVPEAYRARVDRLMGLSAFEPASPSRK